MTSPAPARAPDVVDTHAVRLNQAVVALLSLLAFATGLWPILAVAALHLAVTARFGRRYSLPMLAYHAWLVPRFGTGAFEDARPPRFANVLGAIFLGGASLAHLAGFPGLGWALALLVAALAAVSATTGLCLGCEAYRLLAVARGIRHKFIDRIDLEGLGAPRGAEVIVAFTHPLCSDCTVLDERLKGRGRPVVRIDVSRRPDLGRKYGVAVVPLAYRVGPDGVVVARERARGRA